MSPQRKVYLMLCILRGHVYNLFCGRVYIFIGTCVKDTQLSPQGYVPNSLYCNHVVYVTASFDPKTCAKRIVHARTANEIEVPTATAKENESPLKKYVK